MKKLLGLIIALAMLSMCVCAMAEEAPAETPWYELDEEECVLTVRLPANATTGYEWTYALDEEAMELVTQEYVQDENPNDLVGVGGTWVASFMGTFNKAGDTAITFSYKRPGETESGEERVVNLFISENNQLQIVSAETVAPEEEWCVMDESESVVTVRLPANATTGYEWTFEISDPEAVELITSEYVADENEAELDGAGGMYAASFRAIKADAGDVDITFTYAQAGSGDVAEQRAAHLTVVENCLMRVVGTEIISAIDG